jgi:DNA-directed RNA polymerase specialized sigma24 family protein
VRSSGWRLTHEAFTRLLRALDPDEEQAAQKYEVLHHRLVLFFDVRRAPAPQDLADEVLDRVCRRLEEGEIVRGLTQYCYGVASRVQQELWRTDRRRLPVPPEPQDQGDKERRDRCLTRCLEELDPEQSNVLLRYYSGSGRARSRDRDLLAAELGVTLSGLRVRLHRLRGELQERMQRCLEGLRP